MEDARKGALDGSSLQHSSSGRRRHNVASINCNRRTNAPTWVTGRREHSSRVTSDGRRSTATLLFAFTCVHMQKLRESGVLLLTLESNSSALRWRASTSENTFCTRNGKNVLSHAPSHYRRRTQRIHSPRTVVSRRRSPTVTVFACASLPGATVGSSVMKMSHEQRETVTE